MSLENKTVIITGASSGIGEATAKKLAGAGAKVVITARRTERLNELKETIGKEGGTALVVTADVTSKDDWKNIIEKTGANSIKEMGKVMGELKQNYSDTIDFSKAGALIKDLLTNK